MNDEETLLAEQMYQLVQESQRTSPRSLQAAQFVVGVSDLGTCPERTRRMLENIVPADEVDFLDAFLGTAVGEGLERAVQQAHPEVICQAEVHTTLHGDGGEYTVTGHPDMIFPWGIVDGKTTFGLETVKREGSSRQQKFQRHLYAKAAFELGLFPPTLSLDEVKTANVWVDRSGRDKNFHVEMDTFDMGIVSEAARWLDEVVYALRNNEVAEKSPPRQWCQVACGHFSDCRGWDTDVAGIITDEPTLLAVQMHQEGSALAKQAKKLQDEAKATLANVRGITPDGFSVRWSQINETEIKPGIRKAYQRLDISRAKK